MRERLEVVAVVLADQDEEEVGGLAVRRAEVAGVGGAGKQEKGFGGQIGVVVARVDDGHAVAQPRRAEFLAGLEALQEVVRVVEEARVVGDLRHVRQNGRLRLRGKVDDDSLGGDHVAHREGLGTPLRGPLGFGVVVGEALVRHPENAARGPGVDFAAVEERLGRRAGEGDVALSHQAGDLDGFNAQVVRDLREG